MRLYLIRHGETKLNKEFKFIGATDVALSDRGLDQAKAVAERLQGEKIKAIYSSDLIRARQTADIISLACSVPVNLTSGLREIDFGYWERLSYDEIDARYPDEFRAWRKDPAGIQIPGGETWEAFKKRVLSAVNSIIKSEKEGHIAVVSHGGPIKMLISHYKGGDIGIFRDFWPSPGSLNIVEIA
ncbi:MAG: alpha-ribazole phosphatase [Firmicutes bacterium]|nr:alpha-ribazole phosphatase [Bacillota bacterium]